MWLPFAGAGREASGETAAEQAPAERLKWALTRQAFDRLLECLGPERESAALAYERLRLRLVKFFTWERCADPDGCADEALNRVARRLEQGADVRQVERFTLGVARMVLLEERARARRFATIGTEPAHVPSPAVETEKALAALERSLDALPLEQRTFLLEYYRGDGRSRSERRRKMAGDLGIELNALRNRAMRLRERVEASVRADLAARTAR